MVNGRSANNVAFATRRRIGVAPIVVPVMNQPVQTGARFGALRALNGLRAIEEPAVLVL